ncbi:MAG: J domain-containing protein [Elainellaceae cyanobacterium]
MPSKSLKTTFKLPSASLDEAVVYLSERFLRVARGIRLVKSPNDACLLTLCRPLVDRWLKGDLPYKPGQITLIFHSDTLSAAADILMYVPEQGDRFLYTKPHLDPPDVSQPESAPTLEALADGLKRLMAQQQVANATSGDSAELGANTPVNQAPVNQEALVRAISQAFQASSRPMLSALTQLANQIQQLEAVTQQNFTQQKALQAQVDQILMQLAALGESDPSIPQTDEEWRSRIERTWGTVGDYETYSTAYRELHADAPLFDTPDWVMLCELDWAQRLCPTLADLQALLYGPDGAGDEGADILQQFGAHCRDGERYYLYGERGYTAETALQEIAHHPDYSWLPTLRRLWQTLEAPSHKVFALFGWEPAAVRALRDIADPPRQQAHGNGHSGYGYRQAAPPGGPAPRRSLQDYQALLNIGPFAPLTAEAVKRAYRQAMKKAHPDSGGSTQQAQQINEAYQAVMRHYFPTKS